MTKITEAQRRFLRKADELGEHIYGIHIGNAHCHAFVHGEKIVCDPTTIIRLLGGGWLEFYEPMRVRMTAAGRSTLSSTPCRRPG